MSFIHFIVYVYIITISVCTTAQGSVNYCIENPDLSTNYSTEVLVSVKGGIYDLAVSPHTGDIYAVDDTHRRFHILPRPRIILVIYSYINDSEHVNGIAVDYLTPKVYLAYDTGLKAYDEKKQDFINISEKSDKFWKLFMPKNSTELYVTTDKTYNNEVYLHPNVMIAKRSKLNIKASAYSRYPFVVDGKGNFYYTITENERDVTKIRLSGTSASLPYNGGVFLNLAVDFKGRVYGTYVNGLYRLNPYDSNPQLVAALDFNPRRMSFYENGNILFGTSDGKIVSLQYDAACFSSPT